MEEQEIELKLKLANVSAFCDVLEDPLFSQGDGEPAKAEYETIYYDTADHTLRERGLAYRIRKEGDRFIATVKDWGSHEGGLHIRHEWNRVIDSPVPVTEPFSDLPVGAVLQEIGGGASLIPIFSTVFTRTAAVWEAADGSLIEVAADNGYIISGEKRERICELELELKGGSVAAVLEFGAELAGRYPLLVENKSKYLRALILSGLAEEKEEEEELQGNWHKKNLLRDEVPSILIFGLQEIMRAHDKYLQLPGDSKVVHGLRVKIRQLRSLLSFFKPLLKSEQYSIMQEKLKTLAAQFSYRREIDVLIDEWQAMMQAHPALLSEAAALSKALKNEVDSENRVLIPLFSRGYGTPILLGLWARFAALSWNEEEYPEELTLGKYSTARFEDWLKRMEKAAETVDMADHQSVHALRIQGKKLRYVLTCLDDVLKKDQRKMLAPIKKMQSDLGRICDVRRHLAILPDVTTKYSSRSLLYGGGIMIGVQLGLEKQLVKSSNRHGQQRFLLPLPEKDLRQ